MKWRVYAEDKAGRGEIYSCWVVEAATEAEAMVEAKAVVERVKGVDAKHYHIDALPISEPVTTAAVKNTLLLSDMPIEQIRDTLPAVRSAKGVRGKVGWVSDEPDREDYVLDIFWESGSSTQNVWHSWCNKVTVIEEGV